MPWKADSYSDNLKRVDDRNTHLTVHHLMTNMCNPIDVIYRCHGGAFCKGGPNGSRAVTAIKPWMDKPKFLKPRQPYRLCAASLNMGTRFHNLVSQELGIDGYQPTRKLGTVMKRVNIHCKKTESVQEFSKDDWEWTAWNVLCDSFPDKWCQYCVDKGISMVFRSYMDGNASAGLRWSWQQCHDYFVANVSQEMMLWEAHVMKSTQENVSELDRWIAEMQRVNPGVFDDLKRWKEEAGGNNPGMFDEMDGEDGFDE
ncbi:hypothetical protein ACHAQH_003072 [Verticillium albo-atrum]